MTTPIAAAPYPRLRASVATFARRDVDNASNANKTGEPPVHVNTSVGTSERNTNVHDSQRCGTPGVQGRSVSPISRTCAYRGSHEPPATSATTAIAPAKTPAPRIAENGIPLAPISWPLLARTYVLPTRSPLRS